MRSPFDKLLAYASSSTLGYFVLRAGDFGPLISSNGFISMEESLGNTFVTLHSDILLCILSCIAISCLLFARAHCCDFS